MGEKLFRFLKVIFIINWFLFVSVFFIVNVICGFIVFICLLKLLMLIFSSFLFVIEGKGLRGLLDKLVSMFMMNGNLIFFLLLYIFILYLICMCGVWFWVINFWELFLLIIYVFYLKCIVKLLGNKFFELLLERLNVKNNIKMCFFIYKLILC